MAGAKSSANCHLLHHGEELLHLAWHQGVWASLEFLEEVGVVNQNHRDKDPIQEETGGSALSSTPRQPRGRGNGDAPEEVGRAWLDA